MGVTVPGGHIRYLMNKEICLGNPSKKKRRALLNILETEDSHMEHDEIILKFRHSKIKTIGPVLQYFLYTEKLQNSISFTMTVFHFPLCLFLSIF